MKYYQICFPLETGEWDFVHEFFAESDNAANEYAAQHYEGAEWYILDENGENINA